MTDIPRNIITEKDEAVCETASPWQDDLSIDGRSGLDGRSEKSGVNLNGGRGSRKNAVRDLVFI